MKTKYSQVFIRTIVYFNGRKVKVNALLDDDSTKTYLNQDVVFELGIERQKERVDVNVMNGGV